MQNNAAGARLNVELISIKSKGHNVIARLKAGRAVETVVIGAHGDHLGQGKSESSLMKSTDTSDIHYGADDNASGMATVVELARWFTVNKPKLKRNVIFALWSGEELGNLGSTAFITATRPKSSEKFVANVNVDMIGRFNKYLFVEGVGSSSAWASLLEKALAKFSVPTQTHEDPYVPGDSTAFYLAKVPAVTFFTGSHEEYHSPRDTADRLNTAKMVDIISLIGKVSADIATTNVSLPYAEVSPSKSPMERGSRQFRISLGTIPDYAGEGIKGLKISGVVNGGPAQKAGLKQGDVIVHLDQFGIRDIQDYMLALNSLQPNKPTQIRVQREGKEINLQIVPVLRE